MGQAKNRGSREERIRQALQKQAEQETEARIRDEQAKCEADEWWAGLSEEQKKNEIEKQRKNNELRRMLNLMTHPSIRL